MRILVIAEESCAAGVIEKLAEHEVVAVVRGRGFGASIARACEGVGASCVLGSGRLEAEVARLQPELAFHVPALTPADLPCRCISLRFGSEQSAEPEYEAIVASKGSTTVTWEDAGTVVASREVNVSARDTAISLRFKLVQAGLEAMPPVLDQVLQGTAMANGATSDVRPATAERQIDATWEADEVARFIRASTFPPRKPAIACAPDGDRYYIETEEQWRRLHRVPTPTSSPQAGSRNLKGYAADTHWHTNVGGFIVKMEGPGADDATRVVEASEIELVPGAAVSKLAKKKLRMNEPLIGLNAERYLCQALKSTWLGVEGPFVKKFERALARVCGCAQACAVMSGTAALYGALKALGLEDGKEQRVVVPTYTCSACADGVVHAGGQPVAVDCELDTFGLDFDSVKAALDADPRIVGVVIAPAYGVPSRDFHKIWELCKERSIWLCEDNCESYGAFQRPSEGSDELVPVGSVGTICVVSVRSEKMVGVGEGGAILSKDSGLVSSARWWCARAPSRGAGLWRVYEHDAIGQNYRMPELLAAVGLAAAENLPAMIDHKQRIHAQYERAFQGSGLTMQQPDPAVVPVWWLNPVMLPEDFPCHAEQVGMSLMAAHPEIEVRPAFFPLHMMKPFRANARPCPNAENAYRRLFCLPSSALLTDADVSHVAQCALDAIADKTAANGVNGNGVNGTH